MNTLLLLNSYVNGYLNEDFENSFNEMNLQENIQNKEKAIQNFLNRMYKRKLNLILNSIDEENYISKNIAITHVNNKLFYAHLARIMVTDISLYSSIINLLDIAINGANCYNTATIVITLAGLYADSVIDNKNIIEELEESLRYVGKMPTK